MLILEIPQTEYERCPSHTHTQKKKMHQISHRTFFVSKILSSFTIWRLESELISFNMIIEELIRCCSVSMETLLKLSIPQSTKHNIIVMVGLYFTCDPINSLSEFLDHHVVHLVANHVHCHTLFQLDLNWFWHIKYLALLLPLLSMRNSFVCPISHCFYVKTASGIEQKGCPGKTLRTRRKKAICRCYGSVGFMCNI